MILPWGSRHPILVRPYRPSTDEAAVDQAGAAVNPSRCRYQAMVCRNPTSSGTFGSQQFQVVDGAGKVQHPIQGTGPMDMVADVVVIQ